MRTERLFIVSIDPKHHQLAVEVLSEIMTFAAFDVPLRVLLLDNGVTLLSHDVDSEISGMLKALPLYGVSEIFVEKESLLDWGLHEADLAEGVMTLSRAEVADFILTHEGVISG